MRSSGQAVPLSTLLLLNLSALLSSCFSAPQPELLVAAAADLTPLEQPLARATGLRVRFVLGASGMLARQIEYGAPYDVFLSANERFVRDLTSSGHLLPDSVTVYAEGRLGLWSKSGAFKSLAELKDPRVKHIAMANPVHAPYGAAAKQALERQGLWQELQPRIVYGENVRQALELAESGNADAVITAWSLVKDKSAILLPASLHAPIRQAGGIVAASGHPAEARRFLAFLTSPEGRKLLEAHGLFPPGR